MQIRILDLNFLGNKKAIAAFLIETKEGLALIESGPHSTWEHLTAALAQHGHKPSDIKHLFLSHIHFDHAGAAWAFAKHETKIYVHPKGAPYIANPEKLYNSAKMIYGDKMDYLWGKMEGIEEKQLYIPTDRETITVLGIECTAHYTPGHASHHIAWEVKKAKSRSKSVVFTGDVAGVRIRGGIVVPPCPPPDIHVEHWKASIKRLLSLNAKAFYLTHYGKVTDTQQHLENLEARLDVWAAFIKKHIELETPKDALVPLFEAYAEDELRTHGIGKVGLARYNAANPPYMSVTGLMRYWKKHGGLKG